MLALTETVSLSTPMETLTLTGFTVPVKLVFWAAAGADLEGHRLGGGTDPVAGAP